MLRVQDGVGSTNMGALSAQDPIRILYASLNSLDTDNGKYPQNTFRLMTKSAWDDFEASLSFGITALE